jgi:hypothetical protein
MADIKIKVKCIKEGKMESGEIFSTKGFEYDAVLCEDEDFFSEYGDDDEKYWYFVEDNLCQKEYLHENDTKPYPDWHSMDKEFFEEYFEII